MLRTSLLLVALSSFSLAQSPTFQPKEGTAWTRIHHVEMRLGFDRVDMVVNGQPSGETEFDIEVVSTNRLVIEDAVLQWKPNGLRHLERIFVEASRNIEAPVKMTALGKTSTNTIKVHGESPLQNLRVDFQSKAPGKEWLPSFSEGMSQSLPKKWLRELEVDLDYALLLPPENTKTGGRWNVDAKAFLMALNADQGMPFDFGSSQGGRLPLWIGGVAEQPELTKLWDSYEDCSVQCKLMPQRKAGHRRLLEIQVNATFDGETDLADWAMASMDSPGESSSEMQVLSASQNTIFTGSGIYLWDLDRRVMHSFNFRGEGRFIRDQDMSVITGDEEMSITLNTEGSFDLSANATAK